MSAEAAKRRRRHKADRFWAAQLAPRVDPPEVLCRCGDQELLHTPKCIKPGCGCTEYRERGECGGC